MTAPLNFCYASLCPHVLLTAVSLILVPLCRVDAGSVANVSNVHLAFIFSVDPEEGSCRYVRAVCSILGSHSGNYEELLVCIQG
jgi:hypothetical protein